MAKIILDGFTNKAQAQKWLDWYCGVGEQDNGIPMIVGADVLTDCKTGMIEHPDGWEYKVKIYPVGDPDGDAAEVEE